MEFANLVAVDFDSSGTVGDLAIADDYGLVVALDGKDGGVAPLRLR